MHSRSNPKTSWEGFLKKTDFYTNPSYVGAWEKLRRTLKGQANSESRDSSEIMVLDWRSVSLIPSYWTLKKSSQSSLLFILSLLLIFPRSFGDKGLLTSNCFRTESRKGFPAFISIEQHTRGNSYSFQTSNYCWCRDVRTWNCCRDRISAQRQITSVWSWGIFYSKTFQTRRVLNLRLLLGWLWAKFFLKIEIRL